VMNLVSLLILPAVISLRNNDGARYAIAGAALLVIAAAVAFSKRKSVAMDGAVEAAATAEAADVMNGDRDATLKAAIDRWIYDLGHEEHELRDRLLEVKRKLEATVAS